MEVKPIDQMPHLMARLGKARTDRIRYTGQANLRRQPASTNIHNTLMDKMQYVVVHDNSQVDDILHGVALMDQHSIPLSVSRLYNILQCMEMINTREVMKMMGIDKRQAQRYVRAIKLAFPILSDNL